MICAFITAIGGIVASRKMFAAFLAKLLRNPVRLFEQRLMGVIMNRCSDDMAALDYVVHFTFRSMLMVIMSAIGSALVVFASTPWALVTLPFVVPGYFYVQVLVSCRNLIIHILVLPV